MKKEDLMIGDWVIFKDLKVPVKVCSIMNHYETSIYFYYNGSEFIVQDFQIEPVPLTPEILEKNGFTKYDVGHNVCGWTIMDEHYNSIIPFTLTDNDFDTEQGEYKWGPVEDDREESFVREIGRINYVHELQHALKLCKIEKEIVL